MPSCSGMLWSPGWCGGSRLASISENRVANSWYSSGISGEWSWFSHSSMALMLAAEIGNVVAASCTRHSFLTVLLNMVREMAAMSMVHSRGSGIYIVVALVVRGAHVVVNHGETKLMVFFSQSTRRL